MTAPRADLRTSLLLIQILRLPDRHISNYNAFRIAQKRPPTHRSALDHSRSRQRPGQMLTHRDTAPPDGKPASSRPPRRSVNRPETPRLHRGKTASASPVNTPQPPIHATASTPPRPHVHPATPTRRRGRPSCASGPHQMISFQMTSRSPEAETIPRCPAQSCRPSTSPHTPVCLSPAASPR